MPTDGLTVRNADLGLVLAIRLKSVANQVSRTRCRGSAPACASKVTMLASAWPT
jgi:hypothetical protein